MKNLLFLFLYLSIGAVFSQSQRGQPDSALAPFYHGVASGDPLHDRVIIWTRITSDTLTTDEVQVNWRVATDTGMTNIVASGMGISYELQDFTFKVDAVGLQPYTWYYYDFYALGRHSVRGRTRTAPQGDTDSLRFAVVSCSNYQHGYFNAYKHLMQRNDFDVVLHLGDYIYEYQVGGYSANMPDREHEPAHEVISLDDYRLRYSHYRLDKDLRKLHQQYPFITVWDDHESANDAYMNGADNHDPATEGPWSVRKYNSQRSYHEWMPIRTPQPGSPKIYRTIEYGDLVKLYMLDTRLEGRDEQVGVTSSLVNSPARNLLGQTQFNWLTTELSASTKQWNLLGQQVMMAPLKVFGVIVNSDQWDGYNYEREQLYNHIMNNNIPNMVVLTGDIHTSWANDLPLAGYNTSTGANSAGVEFVTTSITSPGFAIGFGTTIIKSNNPHIQYVDLTKHGFLILDINKQRTQGDWYYITTKLDTNSSAYFGEAYRVLDGERHLEQAATPSLRPNVTPAFAPCLPIDFGLSVAEEIMPLQLISAHPNPFSNELIAQLNLTQKTELKIQLTDLTGRLVYPAKTILMTVGINYFTINGSDLPQGTYVLLISDKEGRSVSKKLIRN
ncbi:MAG: alkaline phosphatase D family protein [Flavobacteriales bacterium]